MSVIIINYFYIIEKGMKINVQINIRDNILQK